MKLLNLSIVIILYYGVSGVVGFFENLHRNPYTDGDKKGSFRSFNEKWITQKLDHFDEGNQETWQMRYLSNDEFYVEGGPFFICVGGEWSINESMMDSKTHLYDMAKDMKGYLFATEHRFYGQSQPLKNTTTSSLQYLNVDQALEDLAHFIRTLKASIPGAANSGVILHGCSYAATMATWFRQRYPELVNGVWASSGPVFAKVDFPEYLEVVARTILKVGGEGCYNVVQGAFTQINSDVENKNFENIQKHLNLCSDIDLNNQLDVWGLFESLLAKLTSLVQYQKDDSIEKACKVLMDGSITNPVEAYKNWALDDSSACYDVSYQTKIKANIDENQVYSEASRQWIFQTCNEFGWYPISPSKQQPLYNTALIDILTKICIDLFNGTFSAEIIEQNVQETNRINGGYTPAITNVFSTQGELDPWRSLGIQADLNPDAPVVIIEGASHCNDLKSINLNDSKQMRETKLRLASFVKKWIGLTGTN